MDLHRVFDDPREAVADALRGAAVEAEDELYARLDLPIGAVLTDNGREFCGTECHRYELYLALKDIEHRKTRVGSPRINGFVERFNGTDS